MLFFASAGTKGLSASLVCRRKLTLCPRQRQMLTTLKGTKGLLLPQNFSLRREIFPPEPGSLKKQNRLLF